MRFKLKSVLFIMNNPKRERHPFTPDEDKKLRELVSRFGEKNWSIISGLMINRTVRQCRDRWTNSLCGNVVKGEWTAEEDSLLLQLFNEYGSRWKSMEKFFPGRAQYDIRNHCKSIVRQKLYAINFLNQKKSASSASKNNLITNLPNMKSYQSSTAILQQVSSPSSQTDDQKALSNSDVSPKDTNFNDIENLVNNKSNTHDLNLQSQENDSSFNESFINEKLLINNNPNRLNLTEKRNEIQPLNDSPTKKSFIDLQKIDPILVPFISKPMLIDISSF